MISTLKALCLIIGAFALAELGLLFHESRRLLKPVNEHMDAIAAATENTLNDANATVILARTTLANVSETMGRINDVSKKQETYWQEMTVTTSDVLNNLKTVTTSFDTLIRDTNASLNQDILPSVDALVKDSSLTVKKVELLMSNSARLVDETSTNLDEIAQGLPQVVTNTQEIMKHTDETVLEVRDMMAEIRQSAPKIMADIESISNRSNKWHPWIMAASLGSTVIGIFGWIF